MFCTGKDNLECAHVQFTKLSGRTGRGMDRRYRDVLKCPDKYRPICKACHKTFDALRKLHEARAPKDEIPF